MTRPRRQEGWRLHAWRHELVWEEFELAGPAASEVLIDVEACGVGLTVLNWADGDLSDDPDLLPVVPGHELVGRVVEVGDHAGDHLLGRRVTAYSYLFCGRCTFCAAGQENRCVDLAGWVGLHRDGGYAQHVVLPVSNVIPVGDDLDAVSATVIPDAVSTAVHVCRRRLSLGDGDRVVVIGAGGGVGIHLVQVAALTGADVVGVDLGPDKLHSLETLGIRAVDGSSLPGLRGGALWDQGGPTAVIDLVGRPGTLNWAVDVLGMGGRMVVVTTFRERPLAIDPRALVSRELSLLASRAATREEYAVAARLVNRGEVAPVIGAIRQPRAVGEIHDLLRSGSLVGRGAITWASDIPT